MPMIAAVPAISTFSLETELRRPPPPLWLESIAPLRHRSPLPGREHVANPRLFILAALECGTQAGTGWPHLIPTTEAHKRIGVTLSPSEDVLPILPRVSAAPSIPDLAPSVAFLISTKSLEGEVERCRSSLRAPTPSLLPPRGPRLSRSPLGQRC